MALEMPDMSAFLNPPLCANNNKQIEGVHAVCQKSAEQCCGSCNLVQYCSKECQVADWPHHKKTCKSAFMNGKWVPDWYLSRREPAFIGNGPPMVTFGVLKYLWGNMPALDVLALSKNEGVKDLGRDLHLLFAASGDIRNLVKTVAGISSQHRGECVAVLNDKDFTIVARNTIMLLAALYFDVDTAVPIMIHLWYSALIPASMLQALQTHILPLIADVCKKIEHKPAGSLQAKTFAFNSRTLRLVLRKEEWSQLAGYFKVPSGVDAKAANDMRRRVTLAPERLDYRERAMIQWSPALRQVDGKFREEGVLLPYGCSTAAFDTPNPTLFQDNIWPMKDEASPSDGWNHADYATTSPGAKADAYGAIFFYLRELLTAFCTRVREVKMSFQVYYFDALDLEQYVGNMKFDRIELSNICDRGYVGPHRCLQVFSPLLKPKSTNPHATLLMLFINAAAETEMFIRSPTNKTYKAGLSASLRRQAKFMPMTKPFLNDLRGAADMARSPDFISRMSCEGLFKDWSAFFDMFMAEEKIVEFAKVCGMEVKKQHTLVEAWPCKLSDKATQADFDLLRSSSMCGFERYVEFERAE